MRHAHWIVGLSILIGSCGITPTWAQEQDQPGEQFQTYGQLWQAFQQTDYARYGEVPLWWWEGEPMARERVTWELETLAAKGVRSVCPIQRSPARCDPPSFTPKWWEMFEFVHEECQRLGMTLWAYDQIGYGHYGWLEKAAAKTQDNRTSRVVFLQVDADPKSPVDLVLPNGECLGVRAYPLTGGVADDAQSVDLTDYLDDRVLRWTPTDGSWRVAVSVAAPETIFQLSDQSTDTFLDMLYGEVERRLGHDAMGKSFVGMFQDEHPSTPRDVYTDSLAELFKQRCGYDIARAIPALHFDVGALTPKYRTDYYDTYLMEDERCYWRRVFEWAELRGLQTSHDNWGRQNLVQQSFGYIDYFRTQRWFSAPGYDDFGQSPLTQRNYYDTKIAASLARLYERPRVWAEVFHSSGWGRTTDQALSWLSANYAFGANLYNEHGLYYSARAAAWEHAAPDPHWRQPYWRYYGKLSDWVARMSFVMSQGTHVTDVAVHYPVAGMLAGDVPGTPTPDYNQYMQLSRRVFDESIDNDIIDDDSILRAQIANGKLTVAGNSYQALVFGPQTTVRREVLEKALAFAESGGCVIFCGQLPTTSTESGREDPKLAELLTLLLGERSASQPPAIPHEHSFDSGGSVTWISANDEQLTNIVNRAVVRDFQPTTPQPVFVTHRRIGETDVYLLQNTSVDPVELEARFRAQGTPQLWDSFTGKAREVDWFEPDGEHTLVRQLLDGNVAQLIVFEPEGKVARRAPRRLLQPESLDRILDEEWAFSVIPTRDNRHGEFRWPPSQELIGPEVRSFKYALETSDSAEQVVDWHKTDLDDSQWSVAKYSTGPYWLSLNDVSSETATESLLKKDDNTFEPGSQVTLGNDTYTWQPVEFSQKLGLYQPAPWGGHGSYPDGAIDQNFIALPQGRSTLFTRIHSRGDQRLGLSIQLRQSAARLWVNGVEQPIEGAVGNLPLRRGNNSVLLELADGGHGMLYVQAEPPTRSTLDEAGEGDQEPPFAEAKWIQVPGTASGYFRKSFELSDVPLNARVVVTGYTGYRLFVNGKQVEEDIGPWARWTNPETVNITSYLQPGKNVIAVWIQVLFDQNVRGEISDQALALAMRADFAGGQTIALVTDETWRGSAREVDHWQTCEFDDGDWAAVKVVAAMGGEPFGNAPLQNVGAVTEPRRRLAVDLDSPNITCFDEVPEVTYDVFSHQTRPVGWYRFKAPPGLSRLILGTTASGRVWVDGTEVPVHKGIATVHTPPRGVSQVAVRLLLPRGDYAGAVFPQPIAMELAGGTIQPGLWTDFALPTYSGIGVYKQSLELTKEEAERPTELDLGNVQVAAELFVNGKSAGVRLARPFRFDLSGYVHAGDNLLEIHVANTIAPHYLQTNRSDNLGPTDSGLLGPVMLRQQLQSQDWLSWAKQEADRLNGLLTKSTDDVLAAQRDWESQYSWTPLIPLSQTPESSNPIDSPADRTVPVDDEKLDSDVEEFEFNTKLTDITGIRLNALAQPRDSDTRLTVEQVSLTASLPNDAQFRGRTVRLDVLEQSQFLHLAEIEVFHDDVNLATSGTARQSTTSFNGGAERAIDGNTDGTWSNDSVSHTAFEANPWWEVDLGAMQEVSRIVIWNRTDGQLQTRLDRFRVSLLDDQGRVVWQQVVYDFPNPKCELCLSPQPIKLVQVPSESWLTSDEKMHPPFGSRNTEVWDGPQEVSQRDGIIFEMRPAIEYKGGAKLVLTLEKSAGIPDDLEVAVTTMSKPLRHVPFEVEELLRIQRNQRSSEQQETLAAYFRSITPQLKPIRERLQRLSSEIRQVTESHVDD